MKVVFLLYHSAFEDDDDDDNNIYLLQLGFYPVAVVSLFWSRCVRPLICLPPQQSLWLLNSWPSRLFYAALLFCNIMFKCNFILNCISRWTEISEGRVKILILLVGVISRVSCLEWSGMPHNQQNESFCWFFCFLCLPCSESSHCRNPWREDFWQWRHFPDSQQLKLYVPLFPLHGAPLCLFAILTFTNCKRKESCLTPTSMSRH